MNPQSQSWLQQNITAIVAILIMVGLGCAITFAKLPDNDKNRMFDIMLLCATFYFGSSKSSAVKDQTIADLKGSGSNPTVSANDSSTVNVLPKADEPVNTVAP